MLEPAKTVIEICGGVDAVAEFTGRDRSRVFRWGYPREKGGSNGFIPAEVADVLLKKAWERGLRPHHFFSELPERDGVGRFA